MGAKYSFIKSKRTNSLLTWIMDLRLNASPGFPALRPQIAYGKRFDLPNDFHLDAQALPLERISLFGMVLIQD